jgi:hypothetical protein
MMPNTEASVFIIESLEFKQEDEEKFEGKFLSQILNLLEVDYVYYYIRTEIELIEILKKFDSSKFRYLHFSFHGNGTAIYTTLGEEISIERIGDILSPYMYGKRLFLSACSTVNFNLAEFVFSKTKCISVIGPKNDIAFDDAAIFWASFYHLAFNNDKKKMQKDIIKVILTKLSSLYQVQINYFTRSNKTKKGFIKIRTS